MSITEDVQQLEPGNLVELFELDCSAIGGDVQRFHGHLQSGSIFWQGNEYDPWPIEASGYERTGDAQQPSPTVTVGNINGVIGAMCLALGDLVGATVRRRRTFGKYLDAKNFPVSIAADEVQFGVGNGAIAEFQLVDGDGHPVTQSIAVESIYRTDWQGKWQLYATPRTNLLTYSQQFETGAWTKSNSTIATAVITAPDGSLTGEKLCDADSAMSFKDLQHGTVAVSASTVNTASVYAQKADRQYLLMRLISTTTSSNYCYAYFDLVNKTCTYGNVGSASGATADLIDDGNGWYRCFLSGTPDTSGTGIAMFMAAPLTAGSSANFQGTVGNGIYIWGADLKQGGLSSYIPTTTAPVTVTDYVLSDSGSVTLGQTPEQGARLTWDGAGEYVSNPTADPNEEFPPELWYIEQKSGDVFPQIEFTLASALDLNGMQLPARSIVANVCMWLTIGGYRGAYCGYTGAACFDANDNPVDDPSQDRCGGRLNSCKVRFGANNPLSIGSFPAADLTSDVQ